MLTHADSKQVPLVNPSAQLRGNWFANAKYFSILLLLLGIGFLGHTTHWNLPLGHGSPHHQPQAAAAESVEQPTTDRWEVRFPSETSLIRSGIVTAPLKQRSIRHQIKTAGVISYDERKTAGLSARVSGTIWRVIKQVGDPVHRGDVLVVIDAAEVGRAKSEFLSELVIVETSTELLKSLESVQDAVTLRQVREARVAVREATIRLQNAEQKLVNLGLSIRLEEFEKLSDSQRATKIHFLGLPDAITKDLDMEQTTSNLLALAAPFDGVVIRHDAALGETTVEGKPIIEISDLRRMWLKLDVPKEDASRLALGQRLWFAPDGIDQALESEIAWIASEVNTHTRTLQVRAEVENPIISADETTGREVRLLRANTFGTGSIVIGEAVSAFVVPLPVVLHADDQPLVFVKTGELSFARLDVKTAIRDQDHVQIQSPDLKPGMEVVTHGGHLLKSESILNSLGSSAP